MKAKNLALILAGVLLIAVTPFGPLSTVAKDVLAEAMASPPSGWHAGRLAAPAGTAFTYQGQLTRAGDPVSDVCSMRFSLWDEEEGGSQIGGTLTRSTVQVEEGLFTVDDLDFGAGAFAGEARWLELAVQCPGDLDYTTLDAREEVTPTPYALHALNADTLDGQHASAFSTLEHTHDGTEITTGTVSSDRLTGAYAGVTEVGTLSSVTITGDAMVGGDYLYSAPKTGYASVIAGAFEPATHNVTVMAPNGWGDYRYIDSTSVGMTPSLNAPIQLPNAATVTNLSCMVMKNSPGIGVGVSIKKTLLVGTPNTTWFCEVFAPTDSAATQVISQTCSFEVDNTMNAYGLIFRLTGSGGSPCSPASACGIYGCRITYEISQVEP